MVTYLFEIYYPDPKTEYDKILSSLKTPLQLYKGTIAFYKSIERNIIQNSYVDTIRDVTYLIKFFTYCTTSNLVACIGFSESKYSALESDGVLTATLLLTGESQLTPFNVTVIASITNNIIPSATGTVCG